MTATDKSVLPVSVVQPAIPATAVSKMTEEELAKSIKEKISSMLSSFSRSVVAAMDVGDLLIEAKARVGHGNFEAWVTEHCATSYRSARRYMGMAKKRGKIEAQLRGKMANLANLNAQTLLTDQRDGVDDGSRDNGSDKDGAEGKKKIQSSPAGEYDALEEKLIAKLKELDADEARHHADITISALNDTVADIVSIAKRAANKAAKLGAVAPPSQA